MNAVMIVDRERAHSCCLGKNFHDYMIKNSSYKDNK